MGARRENAANLFEGCGVSVLIADHQCGRRESDYLEHRVDGNFEETAARIAASEHLYRVALSSGVIETLSSVLVAFALYATLKKVNSLLALLAMVFGLQDSFLECIVRVSEFTSLHLYFSRHIAPVGAMPLQQLTCCAALEPSRRTWAAFVSGCLHSCSFFSFFNQGMCLRSCLRAVSLPR